MRLTQEQLRRFIGACVRDGRPEARELAVEALDRLQRRAA